MRQFYFKFISQFRCEDLKRKANLRFLLDCKKFLLYKWQNRTPCVLWMLEPMWFMDVNGTMTTGLMLFSVVFDGDFTLLWLKRNHFLLLYSDVKGKMYISRFETQTLLQVRFSLVSNCCCPIVLAKGLSLWDLNGIQVSNLSSLLCI